MVMLENRYYTVKACMNVSSLIPCLDIHHVTALSSVVPLISLRRLFSWSRIETASAAGAGIIFRVFEITSTRRSDLGWTRVRTEYSFIIEDSVHDDMRTRIETRILQWRQLTT